MTPMKQRVFDFIKVNQPCSVKDLVIGGFNATTAGNILARSNLYIRQSVNVQKKGSRYFIYWIDDGSYIKPVQKKAAIKEIEQHPLIVAFYGMAA